jgi:hypothetical protein
MALLGIEFVFQRSFQTFKRGSLFPLNFPAKITLHSLPQLLGQHRPEYGNRSRRLFTFSYFRSAQAQEMLENLDSIDL